MLSISLKNYSKNISEKLRKTVENFISRAKKIVTKNKSTVTILKPKNKSYNTYQTLTNDSIVYIYITHEFIFQT